jgi:hypothetical protein
MHQIIDTVVAWGIGSLPFFWTFLGKLGGFGIVTPDIESEIAAHSLTDLSPS